MIKFYYFPSTNPTKVALCLEETELEYELVPVEIRKGEQFDPTFVAINPNAKTPALVDGDAVLFDSTAIMLYLGEKTGQFMSDPTSAARSQLLSWLMFVATGVGPYSGQAVYFRHFAGQTSGDALDRYMYEAWRHWRLIESQLEKGRFILGDRYTIVDMSIWAWARALPRILGDDAWAQLPNVRRLLDDVNARPASERAASLASRHPFKMEMDEEAIRYMFPYRQTSVEA